MSKFVRTHDLNRDTNGCIQERWLMVSCPKQVISLDLHIIRHTDYIAVRRVVRELMMNMTKIGSFSMQINLKCLSLKIMNI